MRLNDARLNKRAGEIDENSGSDWQINIGKIGGKQ